MHEHSADSREPERKKISTAFGAVVSRVSKQLENWWGGNLSANRRAEQGFDIVQPNKAY